MEGTLRDPHGREALTFETYPSLMIRTLLLALLVLPLLSRVAAQNFTTTFFPLKEPPSQGQPQAEKVEMPTMATDRYVVAWEQTGPSEKKRVFSAAVFDRASQKEVHRGTIPLDPTLASVEEVITIGEDVCIIYRVHDDKELHVTLHALRLSVPKLEPVGGVIKLGFYAIPEKGNRSRNDYWITIAPSPDGSKWGILLHKRVKDKDVQEFACWMKDASLEPLWEHVFKIPTEAERVEARSMHVSDEGVVHAMFSHNKPGNLQTGYWTVSDPRWPPNIGRLDANGVTMKPLDIGAGRTMLFPACVPVEDGLVIGGIVHDKDAKGKDAKIGTIAVGPDLAPRSAMGTLALPGLKPEAVNFLELRANTGTTWMFIHSNEALVTAVGDGTGLKKVGSMIPFADIKGSFELTNSNERPAAVFYDLTKNIEAMRTGDAVRTGVSFLHEPAIITWGTDGKPNVQKAITGHDGVRDILIRVPRSSHMWTGKGILLDRLAGKEAGVILIETK